jgi:5-methylcytosine-specific restriction enzyme A
MPWPSDRESQRRSSTTYGAAWRRARDQCLHRAGWQCQIRLDGCQGAASQADHIIPVSQGGKHEQGNLRAACRSCHAKVTAQQGGGYRRGQTRDPACQPRTTWD